MANEQNLKPGEYKLSLEEAKKGGINSGKARRKKRDLRKALEILLEKDYYDNEGNKLSGTELITTKLFQQAAKGNIKAFETIRSTVGQDPVQKIQVEDVDQEALEELERMVLEDD